MLRLTSVMYSLVVVASINFLAVCPAHGIWEIADTGMWPKGWPEELEPLRKQSRTLTGSQANLTYYEIPFTTREDFEAAWPHILKIKSKGVPITLLRGPHEYLGTLKAGVRIWHPPYATRNIWLVFDGEIVDLNRICLPADTIIIDERFKDSRQTPANEIGTADEIPIDVLVPHASGVSLAEIVKIKEIDGRAGDGPLEVQVNLRTLESSGLHLNELAIIKQFSGGGGQGPDALNPPAPLMTPGSLKPGQRYWLAFWISGAEVGYTTSNPDGLLKAWPADNPQATQACRQALDRDHFKWKPRFDPETGLSCEHLVDADQQGWSIRVSRNHKVLWQAKISGKRSSRKLAFGFWKAGYNDFPTEMPASGKLLIAESVAAFAGGNEYAMRPGTYSVATGYDPESGTRRATWISRHQASLVDLLHREYSTSGTLKRELRYDTTDDGWFKRDSTYDDRGKRISTTTFRYDVTDKCWVRKKG